MKKIIPYITLALGLFLIADAIVKDSIVFFSNIFPTAMLITGTALTMISTIILFKQQKSPKNE